MNGGIDYASARAAADRAYQVFFRLDLKVEEEKSLFRRGEELYRKYTGKDLREDARNLAENVKRKMHETRDRYL